MADRDAVLATLTDAPLIDEVVAPPADVALPVNDTVLVVADVAVVVGDGPEERAVTVDRYNWMADNGRGGAWHLTARRGDVVRVSAAEAERGEALGALARTTPPENTVPVDTTDDPVEIIEGDPADDKPKKGKR
jgi:hypothetical protein